MEAAYGHVHLVGFFEDPLSKAITLVDHTFALTNYPSKDPLTCNTSVSNHQVISGVH